MKTNYTFRIIFALVLICPAFAFGQINPANNKLGIAVNTPPQNPAFDFDSCFALGKSSGMNEFQLVIHWSTLEPTAGTFDFTFVDLSNFYFPFYNMPVNLILSPINTNVKETPADLQAVPFNDTILINRYKALLDSVKLHSPAINYSSLAIGNEVDVYLGTNASAWSEYNTFFAAVSAHAHTLWPGIKTACKITFPGLTNSATSGFAQQLNTYCDYIGTTYYPLNNDFTVKPVSVVPTDFNTIVSAYSSKPICFYECGYPSSSSCNSSDSLQKEFITQVFTAWDQHAANIRLVDFTWLHDLDTATVNLFEVYYGISDTSFLEYLRTIGLRTWPGNGTDKPAFHELQCQAKQRGYNNLNLNCINGIESENLNAAEPFNLFPNPAQNEILIESFLTTDKTVFEIYNSSGQVIRKNLISANQITRISIEDLSDGLYFLVIRNGDQEYRKKFLVQK